MFRPGAGRVSIFGSGPVCPVWEPLRGTGPSRGDCAGGAVGSAAPTSAFLSIQPFGGFQRRIAVFAHMQGVAVSFLLDLGRAAHQRAPFFRGAVA